MDFVESLRRKAASLNRTIVLPEADDVRMLEAAGIIRDQGIATVILLGNQATVNEQLAAAGVPAEGRRQVVSEAAGLPKSSDLTAKTSET